MNPLRAWRKRRSLTLEDFAAQIGVSSASLSRIERGAQWPARPVAERIAAETGGEVTPNDFMRGTPATVEAAE